jgi:flavin reductase (DIM6/NTAB) family NADH-FMN oxidoreductase RutF
LDSQMIKAFRLIPYGIYLLTARRGPDLSSMVVSWVSQVSYSPPLLMVAVRHNRPALPFIQESRRFTLSLLKKEQKPLVSGLKDSPPATAYEDFSAPGDKEAAPFLKGCLASWDCRLISSVETGDHVLCIGEVQSAFAGQEGDPLTTGDYGKTYIGQF